MPALQCLPMGEATFNVSKVYPGSL